MSKRYVSRPGPLFALITVAAMLMIAASPCLADKKEQAKAKFKEGMELISKENYLGALQAFEASYEILPKPALLYNIAMCQKALFRYVDSIDSFERYLKDAGDKAKPEMKSAAVEAIAEMQRLVGKLEVVDAPEGAEVLVDGKSAGKAPFTEPLIVDPGQHSVQVSADGYRTMRTDVTAASGAVVPLRAALKAVEAWLEVECDDDKAVVRLDGNVVGSCPYEGEVSPGSHVVKVTSPNSEAFEQEVEVAPGGTTSVSVAPSGGGGAIGDEGGGASPLFVGGLVSLGLGAGAGVLGAVFHARGVGDEKDLDRLSTSPDKDAYDAKDKDLKTDQAMTIVGYSLAGALIATGVVLLVIDATGDETDQGEVAVKPAPGGLVVTF